MGQTNSQQNGYGLTVTTDNPDTQVMDYVGGTTMIYLGEAAPGTATSAAAWRIRKMTYDGNGNITNVQWAGGTNAYINVWDNRAGLAYS